MGYRGKVEAQNRARDLRALGWTYKEICDELGVSRSSVSLWVRDVEFDRAAWEARADANYKNGNHGPRPKRQNRLQLEKGLEIARMKAQGAVRIGRLTEQEFLIAGVALYVGEGAKTANEVKVANSDPRLLLFFVTWLRHFYEVDESRLRLRLYLHEGLDLEAAEAFWSDLLGIPRSQMTKPYRAVPDPSIRKAKHVMGCPAVYYSSSTMLRSILGLCEALLACPFSLPG
jgi:transcriptional regulator with XRE-family HTH domain